MKIQRVDMLYTIRQFYNDISLIVDVMYINDVLFVTSVSENINYRTVSVVDNLTYPKLEGKLQGILRSYAIRRFRVVIISINI